MSPTLRANQKGRELVPLHSTRSARHMAVHVTAWDDALRAGVSPQRWAKQAMMETHDSHPSLRLILLRQALSSDPTTRRWLQEHDQNSWTPEALIKDFIAKFASAVEADAPPQVESHAPWTSLPPEVLFRILSYLPPADLRSCTLVCRVFRTASNDDALWRAMHIRAWGDLPKQPQSWRKQFAKSCFPSETKQSSMRVRLDRDVVWSGQTTPLTGEVYVRLLKPITTTGLTVTMFGSEKVEISGRRDSANRSAQWDKAIITHEYFTQQRHLLGALRDDSDYLDEPKPITLAAGLYTVPFSFTVPAYGIHGRTLQRSFAHTDPLVIVAYGVTAKITIKPTSALDSLVSVFTQTEFSATATFYVDRFYESTLLRMPEPETDTKEMTFMFGGPVRAQFTCDSRATVVGSAGFNLRLQIDNTSKYDVIGATLVLSSYCRRRAFYGEVAPNVTMESNEKVSVDKELVQLPCPFVQATSGISTAWNIPFPIAHNIAPSILHGHLFEYNHAVSIQIRISYTLSLLTLRLPVVLLGPNFSS